MSCNGRGHDLPALARGYQKTVANILARIPSEALQEPALDPRCTCADNLQAGLCPARRVTVGEGIAPRERLIAHPVEEQPVVSVPKASGVPAPLLALFVAGEYPSRRQPVPLLPPEKHPPVDPVVQVFGDLLGVAVAVIADPAAQHGVERAELEPRCVPEPLPRSHLPHLGFQPVLCLAARHDQQLGPIRRADKALDVKAQEVEAVVDMGHVCLLNRPFESQLVPQEALDLVPQPLRLRLA
jgi:hypothetical protein